MSSSVRINVRVLMGNAIAQFQRLQAQIRALDAAAAASGAGAGGFRSRWTKAFSDIELAGKRLAQTGRILTYNFTLPLVAGFAALEKEFLKASKASATLSQVYETASGETKTFGVASEKLDGDLKELDRTARILSDGFGVAKSEVTDLMVIFGRAGLSGVQIAEAAETGLTLMQAFGTTAQQAADAYLTAATSYQLSGKQTAVAMAALGYAANETRADVQTLSAGFVKAAPVAQQLGIDVVHLASMLAVMQQAGFKGAEAGTALNFAFTRLVKSTPESIDLFRRIGLNLDEAAFAAANGTQKFDMVTKSLQGLTGAQQAVAIATLFGVRQQPKLTAFFADALKKGGLYEKLLRDMSNSTELLAFMDNQLILSLDNVSDKFKILKTQMMNNFMVIATLITPALLALMQVVARGARWFAELGNTASGRTKQSFIVLGLVFLALVGPLIIIIASIVTLIGFLGGAVSAVMAFGAALLTPWGIVIAGLSALIAFSARFRAAFIGIFQSIARAIMQIAMVIYAALQWMNPFARHSPSLVEQTRDGVAAMVGYWNGLSPVLGMMDKASGAVRRLQRALQSFTESREAAAQAEQRADIGAVSGAEGVRAYDALIQANRDLAATLPGVARQYDEQAASVAAAKARLAVANDEIERAENGMKALEAAQRSLQDSMDKLGDPQALQSQATAASNMARTLAEAGNTDLARQFAEQATAMQGQADEAMKQQAQLDKVDAAIENQSAAIDRLTQERDALSATYDLEVEKLQALETGYRAVEDAIRDNASAMDVAASSSRQYLDEMEQARKAAESAAEAAAKADAAALKGAAGGAGKRDPFAQFDAAAGADMTPMTGDMAVPGPPPGGFGEDLGAFNDELQAKVNERMANLFPNPFKMIGDWLAKLQSAWGKVTSFFDSLGGGSTNMNLLPAFDVDGWARPILDAVRDVKAMFSGISFDDLGNRARDAGRSIQEGIGNAVDKLREPFNKAREVFGEVFGFLIRVIGDVVAVIGGRLMQIAGVFVDFWKENGAQIGTIVGVIVGFFVDWYVMLAKIVLWAAEKLWPIFRMALDGIMQAIQGVIQMFSGLFQFIIQMLTGNFGKAWEGFKRMLSGLGNIVVGLGKALIGAIVGFVIYLAGTGIAAIGTALGMLLPLIGRLVVAMVPLLGRFVVFFVGMLAKLGAKIIEYTPTLLGHLATFAAKIPGAMWNAIKAVFGAVWKLAEFIGAKIVEWSPGIFRFFTDMMGKVPGLMWDGFKGYWTALFKLAEFIGAKVAEWAPVVFRFFVDMITKIPGLIWDGFKATFSALFKFGEFIGTKVAEYAPVVFKFFLDMIKKVPGLMWDGLKIMWNGLWKLGEFVGTKIAEYTPVVIRHFVDMIKKVPGLMWDGLKIVFNAVFRFANFLGDKVREWGPAIMRSFVEFIGSVPRRMWDEFTGTFARTFEFGRYLVTTIGNAVRSVMDAGANLGRDIVSGVINGIKNNAFKVADAIRRMAENAWKAAIDFFKIGSPSKLMQKTVGANVVSGLVVGIDQNAGTVADSMVAMAQSAYNQLAAVQAANLSLPTLVQNVALNYVNDPLSALATVTQDTAGVGGLQRSLAGSGASLGGSGNLTIQVDATNAEVADPMALAQTLGWSLRTQVR